VGDHAALVDSHAHLTFSKFDGDRLDVLDRAWKAGVEQIVTVGSGEGIDGNRKALELAGKDARIWATVGVHPHDADGFEKEWITALGSMLGHERVVAVGEAGLDYHYMNSSKEAQAECFRAQLKLAHQYDLPIIIHDRDAHDDLLSLVREEGVPKAGGVFHCFSGDLAYAEKVLDAGFHISFSGIVTFPKAHDVLGVAAEIPLERMLIETDCPYLAPQPHRGKRNEPAFVRHVAETIAEAKELDLRDVARVTSINAKRLFNLPGAELEPRVAYRIRNSLYLNVTNRCNLACTFCPKFTDFEVKGHCLKLEKEPDIEQIFQAMGHPQGYDEVVFCGYGEPTVRLELVKEVARRMKDAGVKRVRLNTDGLASKLYDRCVPEELKGLIDAVSVSLNAPDAETYAKLCPSRYGAEAYENVKQFIRDAKRHLPEVLATAVAVPGLDVEACRRVAEDELGVTFKAREYMEVG
jgi:TatD DNase family protein